MAKLALTRICAGCAVFALATPAAALAHGHGHGRKGSPPGRTAGVCKALSGSGTLPASLAGLSTAQLATLRSDCAAITTAQHNAESALTAARTREQATLAPARAAVKAACQPPSSRSIRSGHTLSASCLAALQSYRTAEHSASTAYATAAQAALAPVSTATKQLASDLAADGVAGGSRYSEGGTGHHGGGHFLRR